MRLLADQGTASDLANGVPDFLEAVDFAFDWLNREDPERHGTARVAIFATRDGVTEEVWAYPVARYGDDQELVDVFGFNPVTWVPGVREFSGRESRRPLARFLTATVSQAEPLPSVEPVAEAAQAAERTREPEREPEPDEPAAVAAELEPVWIDAPHRAPWRATLRLRRSIATTARREWADPISRCCLVFAGAALWLSVTLADPSFLTLLFASIAGLWWRRRRRTAAPATTDDDWL